MSLCGLLELCLLLFCFVSIIVVVNMLLFTSVNGIMRQPALKYEIILHIAPISIAGYIYIYITSIYCIIIINYF